ncbi:MAG: hypothetical protein ACR2QO_01340, partial [Acidimicrobiales bacterium]
MVDGADHDRAVSEASTTATKLRAPSLRDDRLPRPRIASLLSRRATPLILVSAPAGFGKTTAVVDWLQTEDHAFVWINLDDRDDHPHRFFSLVAEALYPIIGAGRLAGVLTSGSDAALGPSLLAAALLDDLEGCDEPLTMVLDDLHNLAHPVITEVLDIVASSLPETLQLVLVTRSDPPIRLGRLRAAGLVTEIRSQHLEFTNQESTNLLEHLTNTRWPSAVVESLNQRVEGWPVGLQLAGLSLIGRGDTEGFVRALRGDDRYIADYLIEEVLDREEPEIREFLLETSVVDEMCAELCRALTGRTDATEILADLYHRNLFIVALTGGAQSGGDVEGGGGTWYRYHSLFADLLNARLTATSPHRVTELLATAAQWAEQHGDLDQALRYHLRRLDRASATGFARRHLPGLIARGQISRHRSWVAQFPNEWIEADAELLLCRAEAEVFGIEPQQALRDLDEVERLVGQGASTIAAGRVELRRAMASFFAGDYEACLDNTARSLGLIGEREPELSAVAHLYRGVVRSIRDDRHTAQEELTLAATQAERGGNHYAALSARMSLGALAIHAGDLDQAGHRFEAIEAMA